MPAAASATCGRGRAGWAGGARVGREIWRGACKQDAQRNEHTSIGLQRGREQLHNAEQEPRQQAAAHIQVELLVQAHGGVEEGGAVAGDGVRARAVLLPLMVPEPRVCETSFF